MIDFFLYLLDIFRDIIQPEFSTEESAEGQVNKGIQHGVKKETRKISAAKTETILWFLAPIFYIFILFIITTLNVSDSVIPIYPRYSYYSNFDLMNLLEFIPIFIFYWGIIGPISLRGIVNHTRYLTIGNTKIERPVRNRIELAIPEFFCWMLLILFIFIIFIEIFGHSEFSILVFLFLWTFIPVTFAYKGVLTRARLLNEKRLLKWYEAVHTGHRARVLGGVALIILIVVNLIWQIAPISEGLLAFFFILLAIAAITASGGLTSFRKTTKGKYFTVAGFFGSIGSVGLIISLFGLHGFADGEPSLLLFGIIVMIVAGISGGIVYWKWEAH